MEAHYVISKKRSRESKDVAPGKDGGRTAAAPVEEGGRGRLLAAFILEIDEGPEGVVYVHARAAAQADAHAAGPALLMRVTGFPYSFFIEPSTTAATLAPTELLRRVKQECGLSSLSIEPVRRTSLVGSSGERDLLRISFSEGSRNTSKVRAALDAVLGKHEYREYESQVDMETRFSLETGLRCGSWIEIPDPLVLQAAKGSSSSSRVAQFGVVESHVRWDAGSQCLLARDPGGGERPVVLHSPTHSNSSSGGGGGGGDGGGGGGGVSTTTAAGRDLRWSALPSLKILSLSVTRSPARDVQERDVDEDTDPVRMVGLVMTRENGGARHGKQRVVLVNATGLSGEVQEALPKDGPGTIRVYGTERELLQAFEEAVVSEDPDVLTGFEVGEGLRVLMARAAVLKLGNYGMITRRMGEKVAVKRYQSYTAKWAKTKARLSTTTNQEGTEVRCAGRVVIDMMRIIQQQDALRLYSLGDISMATLNQTFEVLTESQMAELLGSSQRVDRRRAMAGGLSAADLALDVMHRRDVVSEVVELSRVMGLGLNLIAIRGQIARVTSLLLQQTHRAGMVVPSSTEGELDKHQLTCSALLLDPMPHSDANPEGIGTTGMHRSPVAVLDYASLYPSVIIEHNLCYSTLVTSQQALVRAGLSLDDTATTPIGARFVSPSVRVGVIPGLLQGLLDARRHALAEARNPNTPEAVRRVLNARQKALKLCANACYGFFGATVNSLFSRELGDSVLALGRWYLNRAISLVHEHHPSLRVIYGDTDSIFIRYPEGWDAARATAHSRDELTPMINAQLPARVQLKHESVLQPLLLQHIRRYAALDTSKPAGDDDALVMRGIEAVQRNTMPFLVTLMVRTLRLLLTRSGATDAKAYVRSAVADLLADKLDLHSLMHTRGLWRLGEYESKLPHVNLVERMEAEDPRRYFRVGQRVAYVLVQRDVGDQLYKKSEDPWLAQQRGLRVDTDENLKQVRMPMVRLLSLVMPESEAEDLFRPTFRRAATSSSSSAKASGIRGFFAKSNLQCVACRAMVPASSSGGGAGKRLCSDCKSCPSRALLPAQEAVNASQRPWQAACQQCLRCQRAPRSSAILCSNDTCPVLYRRLKYEAMAAEASSRLADIEEVLEGLGV